MVKQCTIIFGCLALGEFIVWLTGIPIPSSILGMLLLVLLLESKVVKARVVKPICTFLLSNLGFFFIPPGVALMVHSGVLRREWLPITVATVLSTVLVLVCTSWAHKIFMKYGFSSK